MELLGAGNEIWNNYLFQSLATHRRRKTIPSPEVVCPRPSLFVCASAAADLDNPPPSPFYHLWVGLHISLHGLSRGGAQRSWRQVGQAIRYAPLCGFSAQTVPLPVCICLGLVLYLLGGLVVLEWRVTWSRAQIPRYLVRIFAPIPTFEVS